MKPEIENLKVWMIGKTTTEYQRTLAMREFEQLLSYIDELEQLSQVPVSGSLPLQTKLEMFYDFLYERGVATQLEVGIDTIVKHFIDEKLSGNDH